MLTADEELGTGQFSPSQFVWWTNAHINVQIPITFYYSRLKRPLEWMELWLQEKKTKKTKKTNKQNKKTKKRQQKTVFWTGTTQDKKKHQHLNGLKISVPNDIKYFSFI